MIESTSRSGRTSVRELTGIDDLRGFRAAVSLHAHTYYSRESMTDVPRFMSQVPLLGAGLERELRACIAPGSRTLDYSKMWWHPPVSPRVVFDSETRQIEERLDLPAVVSVTDHDDIRAGIELQTLYAQRRAPLSFEWTVPYACAHFHLGVHNVPAATADAWFARLVSVSRDPTEPDIEDALRDLDAQKDVLIVLNHPQWDLADVGADAYARLLRNFLDCHRSRVHALELNGYRSWRENSRVRPIADATGLPLISGGDRHGAAPNALLNLTHASSFAEFVDEVRAGISHVVVMPEYRQHLASRVVASVSDVFRNHRSESAGPRLWTERVSWSAAGEVRTLSSEWPDGGPLWIRSAIRAFNLMTTPAALRMIGTMLDLLETFGARERFRWAPTGRPSVRTVGVDVN